MPSCIVLPKSSQTLCVVNSSFHFGPWAVSLVYAWSIPGPYDKQCVMCERNKTHLPVSETTVFRSYRLHKHTVINTSTRTWKHSRFNNDVLVKKSILAFMEVHVKQDNFAIVINVCYKMLQQLSLSVKNNTSNNRHVQEGRGSAWQATERLKIVQFSIIQND